MPLNLIMIRRLFSSAILAGILAGSGLVVISVHYGAVDHESRRIRKQTIG